MGAGAMSDINQSAQTLAMRLIFEYEGDQVRLVTQQPVDVSITGVDLTHTQREGYYVYTSDASGRVLARVLARGAFQHGVEVFPERAGEPITRMDVDRPRGAGHRTGAPECRPCQGNARCTGST